MKVVIFGSRSITDALQVEYAVAASGVFPEITEIVSGAAAGVDTLAIEYARKRFLPCRVFPADWQNNGRKAGALRNEEMAAYADYGIAVWNGKSRGTGHMISLMQGRVSIWRVD
jgi:hypothetical protein